MRLEVLRATALCWYGNEHLLSIDESHLTEVTLKSCFQGVERLEFVRPTAHQFAAPGASFVLGTKMWFRRLKAERIEALRLHLPLSLLEPLPPVMGIVSDSSTGNEIWVPATKRKPRNVEYHAQRFAAWSLPQPQATHDLAAQLATAVTSLNAEFGAEGKLVARRITKLAASFKEPGARAEGFEDCIPTEFEPKWRHLAARALRCVAMLGVGDLDIAAHPAVQRRVDEVWKLSLRLLEAISVEVVSERIKVAA
jgi:hypothetical protein